MYNIYHDILTPAFYSVYIHVVMMADFLSNTGVIMYNYIIIIQV